MLMEDPKCKSGWKFDHVWNIIKKIKKFQDQGSHARQVRNPCGFGYTSSESKNHTHDSATQASPSLSSFSLNLDDSEDVTGGTLSQRPIGVKKSKLKRKCDDQTSIVINTLEEGNKRLLEQLERQLHKGNTTWRFRVGIMP